MHSTDFDFLASLTDGNLRLAEDALLLLAATQKSGVLQRARAGKIPYGSPEFRVYTGLYALADTIFQQTESGDSRAFDLYDALIAAWPERSLNAPEKFLEHYWSWRNHEHYSPVHFVSVHDFGAHRRVAEFIRICA